ncbi:YjjG family noncanonical pyrimidine nucleotidase [Lapidilactobacillus bayanensis]|uniref:YjjG family noncanonical pyrimidine nucleotidase n=1 Tax=Lapidilactobacillus bayanensis TaxID=2485998 RepID=UPI000F76D3B6|nr:YjjG family noncanonical pyrimidine nucleotidase [Lapidilactobacillus bayanensis]
MAYQTLLFDIDDTLLDFGASEDASLALMFDHFGIALTDEIKKRYEVINQNLWRQFERQEIDRQTIFKRRFPELFTEFHLATPEISAQAEAVYREGLNHGHQQVPQAQELLARLSKQSDLKLYIVSNGVAKTQNMRLHDSGFARYFQQVFVSETVGHQKPDIRFFEAVEQGIADFDRRQALIIGDSLTSDIQGGINAGIDTVWYNPRQLPFTAVQPTYQIAELLQLLEVIK